MTEPRDLIPSIAATEIDVDKIAVAVAKRLSAGPLNLHPLAAREPLAFLGGSGFGDEPPKKYALNGGVAIVSIKGILLQEAFDLCGFELASGYDRIVSNVRAATESDDVESIVLAVNSPGGMAIGNREAAEEIRELCADADKPLIALVTSGCSAAYALACAADGILCLGTAQLGCIGTLAARLDASTAMAAVGLREIVAAWPPGKAVQSETGATSDEVHGFMLHEVKPLAEHFMSYVGARRNMTRDAVFALNALTYIGAEAVTVGLADRVVSEREALAYARSKSKRNNNRKVYSMGDPTPAPSAADSTLTALRDALGLAGDATPTQLAEACAAVINNRAFAASIAALTGLPSTTDNAQVVTSWKQAATVVLPATRSKLLARTVQLAVSTGRMTPGQAYAADQDAKAREFPALPVIHPSLATKSLEVVELEIESAAPHAATLPSPKPKRVAYTDPSITQEAAEKAGFKGPSAVADYQAYIGGFGPPRAGQLESDQ